MLYNIKNAFFLIIIFFSSCQTNKKIFDKFSRSNAIKNSQLGVMLKDIQSQKVLIKHNETKLFLPASNTKLLTFYVGLKNLPDSVTALKYTITNDSLIFCGMADPSTLYSKLPNHSRLTDFLASRKEKLFLHTPPQNFTALGKGWAWDDYLYSFGAERSNFPIYGNCVNFSKKNDNTLKITPHFFEKSTYNWTSENEFTVNRDLDNNMFSFPASAIPDNFHQNVPFKTADYLSLALLSDTTHQSIERINFIPNTTFQYFRSTLTDSLYKRMLQYSDNLVAEQLLCMISEKTLGEINPDKAIDSLIHKGNLNLDFSQSAWVDGSGTSRYNLFSPTFMVDLLLKIKQNISEKRLFELLPTAGKSGTIASFYDKNQAPFVYAKSGSLSNNYNLSGYLISKKGKRFAFSIMVNNTLEKTAEIKKAIADFLLAFHKLN